MTVGIYSEAASFVAGRRFKDPKGRLWTIDERSTVDGADDLLRVRLDFDEAGSRVAKYTMTAEQFRNVVLKGLRPLTQQ